MKKEIIRRYALSLRTKGKTYSEIKFIERYNKKAKPFAWCYGEPLKI